ncbi:methionine ABC transporter ATP-binding protein [Chelatococcus asaccharovorans]|uniref:methionine ABC transporter ATP-binding protein n=1 Tax=Chelatococcus asaccharovorans TaxID=28210 RepID=UPI00224C7A7A|nr:methionine ABC transporter ATP-binding protein [Chelatococcus asaccharovorans]CAH1654200.1 L-methionine/D-methionine ABC transporter ATP binding subunit [Chelatococcus asaccharovorans]CAH1685815.1 L-methionine/D-methionine ABC transporter ATP binding subunit [Chelatococcus asaccharovorans]
MNALSFHPPDAAQPPQAADEAVVRFEGVAKTFAARGRQTAVAALEDIDLTVRRGAILGVIGRSGAGKSTLIRLVNGLEKPTAGRVLVDGTDVARLPEKDLRQLRRSIGMIFQHFNLLSSRTVYDNIALPLEIAGASREDIRQRVDPLIELVGLADKRNRYPAELSGGQKQRVGIARALATRPKVLLSDEATSALDPETTRSILDLLATINAELKLTILLITHEMAVIRGIARDVAVIDNGRIVEKGDVFDLFTRPRHPTTRTFLAAESGRALPAYVAERLTERAAPGSQAVLRIIFRGSHATDPVLSQITRTFAIDVNILGGTVDAIAGRPFGTLIVAVPDEADLLKRVTAFLTARGLDVEALGFIALEADRASAPAAQNEGGHSHVA